jgi:fucose 4-O-acetylase-like acetyltransferase
MKKQRDIWVDDVKIIACFLVVLGHFFQSLVKSDILPDGFGYRLFNDTIYYFHVPLFFICSGFLYQKYSTVRTLSQWKTNVLKKLLTLGVPYFVFSLATWLLKKLFSSSVNSQIEGLKETLFENPTAPYWYLYTLFFIFVITLTASNRVNAYILLIISTALKIMTILKIKTGVFAIDQTAQYLVWFVIGMLIAKELIPLTGLLTGLITLSVFIVINFLQQFQVLPSFRGYDFIMGVMACYSIICIVHGLTIGRPQKRVWLLLGKYTMPVFLMHTLSAAPLRSVLIKAGIGNAAVHIVAGLIASFGFPVLVMIILEKLRPADFIVYPGRYIKFNNK